MVISGVYTSERGTQECEMSLSFPKAGNWTEIVGQTPWSAWVPLDPLVANEFSSIQIKRADEGVGRRHCA